MRVPPVAFVVVVSLCCVSLCQAQQRDDWYEPTAPGNVWGPKARSAGAPSGSAPERGPHRDSVATPTHLAWYGWQTLLVDVAALGAGVAASTSESDQLGYAALGIYGLGGPSVHMFHEKPGRATLSLGARVLFPILAGGYFAGRAEPDVTDGGTNGDLLFIFGAGIGMVAASLVDGLVLGWERVPTAAGNPSASRPERRPPRVPRLPPTPRFSAFGSWVPGGVQVGIGGSL